MELPAVAPQSAPDDNLLRLQRLREGVHQTIVVHPTKLLERIMDALGAKPPSILSETDCGDEGLKLSIQLELPVAGGTNTIVCDGAPSTVRSTAEKNAIMSALKHLSRNCHIQIVDFSSQVAKSLDAKNTYACLAEAMCAVQTMLLHFEKTLGKIKEMALEFDGKIKTGKANGKTHGEILVYVGISSFLASLLQKFSGKAADTLSKFTALEEVRVAHKNRFCQKSQSASKKSQHDTVALSSKYLLDYVLSSFGFDNASYSNGPGDDGDVEGVAMFTVPRLKRLKLCGNLVIKATGEDSESSEQAAAFRALLLMEENFNVTVVDLYHARRVETKRLQAVLLDTFTDVLEVGNCIRDMWSNLMDEVTQHRGNSSNDTSSMLTAPSSDQFAAYQITIQALDRLEQDSAIEGYTICWDSFAKLEQIKFQLNIV